MKHIVTSLSFVIMLAFSPLGGNAQAHETDKITVSDVWSRTAAVVGGNGAGFFVIENHMAEDDLLLRAEADVSNAVELHTMTMNDNIMRMRKIDSVPVPANSTVTFAPGGEHVMFIGLKAPLKEDESFPLTLVFKKAGAITVQVSVLKTAPKAAQGHSH